MEETGATMFNDISHDCQLHLKIELNVLRKIILKIIIPIVNELLSTWGSKRDS